MKQFTLSVPEPCHQNWDEMKPEQNGRFCSSCQKTVVDFTGMTDRQLADFFKRYKGNACGRFYNDQLDRALAFSGAKIFLPKHYFRFAWPVLLLSLQACNEKDETLGKMEIAMERKMPPESPPVAGNILSQLTPVESSALLTQAVVPPEMTTVGVLMPVLQNDTLENFAGQDKSQLAIETDTSFVAVDTGQVSIDTLMLSVLPAEGTAFTMGEVVAAKCQTKMPERKDTEKTVFESATWMQPIIYPNPVMTGQSLTIVLKREFTGAYQIYSTAGQVVKKGQIALRKDQQFSVPVQSWSAGVYVIRFVNEGSANSFTEKFVVH